MAELSGMPALQAGPPPPVADLQTDLRRNLLWSLAGSVGWMLPVRDDGWAFEPMLWKLAPYALVRVAYPRAYALCRQKVYRTMLQMPFAFVIRYGPSTFSDAEDILAVILS